ncbi:MAG: RNA 2',3'-cyclic phosphodiesterase [Solirubrobacterales bacterium]
MFVALDLPELVRRDIAAWSERELTNPALRPVAPESLHVTLAFLGDRPLGEVERIEERMWEIAETPILLQLQGPVGRPERGRPRLVTLPVDSNPVQVRQRELGEWLSRAGLYELEGRAFWPHVTVARVRAEGRGSRRPMATKIPSGPSPTAGIGYFDAVRISLYRSELQPSGAHYVPLAQVELPGRGW